MDRNVQIITDKNGNKVVKINNIRFKGKRSINWNNVEEYLQESKGVIYEIEDTKEIVSIGSDFADEFAHSKYTAMLKGTIAKAKANASQGIREMMYIATNKYIETNRKVKHSKEAMFGWHRYESRFALPIFDEEGKIKRHNVFKATMLLRHARDGKLYLYDVTEIKKETDTLFESEDSTQ
ncbi:MAG: hypothetical protein IJ591_02900 [Lachnospiraceae bacterium]|nr:hypothetical protein [Lachnospiraceae bacterium]